MRLLLSPAVILAQHGLDLGREMGMYSVIVNQDKEHQVDGWCNNARILTKTPDQVAERCREERVPGWQTLSILLCDIPQSAELVSYVLCAHFYVTPCVDSGGVEYVQLSGKTLTNHESIDLRFGQSPAFFDYITQMEHWQILQEFEPEDQRYQM